MGKKRKSARKHFSAREKLKKDQQGFSRALFTFTGEKDTDLFHCNIKSSSGVSVSPTLSVNLESFLNILSKGCGLDEFTSLI